MMVVEKYDEDAPAHVYKNITMKLALTLILIVGFICFNRIWADTGYPESPEKATQNDIYFSLLKDLSYEASPDENVIISMLGGFTTFYAAYLGAAGETQEELEQFVFDESTKFETIISTNTPDLEMITNEKDNQSDDFVVGLFIQKGFSVQNEYIRSLQESFNKINVENVDFGENATTTSKINKFVSTTTGDRIQQLYKSTLDPSTQIILLPAFHSTKAWKYILDASKTKPGQFFTGKKYVDVDMMNDQKPVAYFDNPALQFETIFIPFQNDISSVLSIALPYRTQTLKNLTRHMSNEDLADAFSGSTEARVDYKIPRLKFSSAKSLKSVFRKEGVETIFERPDFSRMTSNKLKVSDIYQAVEIEVNEKGVNISAATALHFSKYLAKWIPKNRGINISSTEVDSIPKYSSESISKNLKTFYVDRPFLLTINGLLVDTIQSMVHQT